MGKIDYTDINSKTIDKWVEDGWEWSVSISHEEYLRAKNGECNVNRIRGDVKCQTSKKGD